MCNVMVIVALLPLVAAAQSWVQVDLNDAGTAAGNGVWNVVPTPTSGIGFLVDTNGTATPATLSISAGWQDSTFGDAKGAYAGTVFGNAAADYFFLRSKDNGYTNGTFTVSGLTNGVAYAVQLASSMKDASSPRTADFRVNGVFGSSMPNGQNFDSYLDGFLGGSVLTWAPVYPVDGQVVISVVRRSTAPDATATLNAFRFGPAGGVAPAPVVTRARPLSDTELELAWTGEFAEDTTFTVTYDAGTGVRSLGVGTSRVARITGLLPSTTYTVRVAGVSAGVPGSSSEPVQLTTQAPPPADKKFEIDFNTVTSASGWICPVAPTSQTLDGLSFTFSNFSDSTAGGHTGMFSANLFSVAANDYFFVKSSSGGLTGTVTISGLPNRPYCVQVCSSASTTPGADRIADYRVNGEFSPLAPTGEQYRSFTDGYSAARVMTWPSVTPVNGVLTVTVQTASSTYYGILNGMRLVELPSQGTVLTIW